MLCIRQHHAIFSAGISSALPLSYRIIMMYTNLALWALLLFEQLRKKYLKEMKMINLDIFIINFSAIVVFAYLLLVII